MKTQIITYAVSLLALLTGWSYYVTQGGWDMVPEARWIALGIFVFGVIAALRIVQGVSTLLEMKRNNLER
ncbi:MAG: hypothetical protein KGZ83_17555 [Sulfuricella sp.]|nr:hypothetical protein [Sulfuricella sp.]